MKAEITNIKNQNLNKSQYLLIKKNQTVLNFGHYYLERTCPVK